VTARAIRGTAGYDAGTVPAMSSAVPRSAAAVPSPRVPASARDSVSLVHAPRVAAFFAWLWAAVALAIVGSYWISIRLGTPPMYPMEYPFIAAIYLMWAPLVPFLVALARRYGPPRVLLHGAVAIVLILLKLVLHRLVFCYDYNGAWGACVLGIRFETWLVRWYLHELLVYAATVGGTWAFDASARADRRELSVAEKERELAAAELQAAQGRIAPHEITASFALIAQKLRDNPAEAESMITSVADSLRSRS
jgi:hypothetical protein